MIDLRANINNILRLRTNDSIGKELADRQFEVIFKSFLYLNNPENNLIYIADEVGLGKTYIAAGISMLFRHFSADIDNHKDLIIVPKKNLQYKWDKELKNFIKNNYIDNNDSIKQLDFEKCIKDKLSGIKKEDPITIFRMTSFSSITSAASSKKTEFYNYLVFDVFEEDEYCEEVLIEAWNLKYFDKANEHKLRKLIAYLFNVISSKIDCLIIDEAHNYKYGIGNDLHDSSIRNEVTARFLGAIDDKSIINDFSRLDLRDKIKFPLANKIICLSATPKDRNLLEIKNQLNCFAKTHVLSDCYESNDVKEKLKSFLVRGNLEYNLTSRQEAFSRNECREEHRKGNVNKIGEAKRLIVEDNFESIFWQLLQYKSIKHLDQKNNKSFEIGMLAGFESYQLDTEKNKGTNNEIENESYSTDSKEYEQTSSRKHKESQDINVVKDIVDSYTEKFKKEPPPHPKQSKLEEEIINQLSIQEKSLIFVRRVATAYELEKRLIDLYENKIIKEKHLKFSGKYSKFNSQKLNDLLSEFEEKHIAEKLDDVFRLIDNRLNVQQIIHYKLPEESFHLPINSLTLLHRTYNSPNNLVFKDYVKKFITKNSKNILDESKNMIISSIENTVIEYVNEINENDGIEKEIKELDVNVDENIKYFFSDYFKENKKGFSFRTKMYRENWFDINLYLIHQYFDLFNYDGVLLKNEIDKISFDEKKKKHQKFNDYQETYKNFILSQVNNALSNGDKTTIEQLSSNTFITELLINHCFTEFYDWIDKHNKGNVGVFLEDIHLLNILIKSIFRTGSGLLPAFIADSCDGDFSINLIELVTQTDSSFYYVLNEIKTILNDFDLIIAVNFQDRDERKITNTFRNLTPIIGTSGQDKRDRGILASQFRMPGYPYVLVTTDIFREGEDLHTYCQNVYHYGIAWNPSDMEQRTGRIDRINSLSYRKLNKTNDVNFDNKIHVFYPYLTQSVEVNQVAKLLTNMNIFIEDFNEIDKTNSYETSVNTNEEITEKDIPKAIKKRLISKYDIHDFKI